MEHRPRRQKPPGLFFLARVDGTRPGGAGGARESTDLPRVRPANGVETRRPEDGVRFPTRLKTEKWLLPLDSTGTRRRDRETTGRRRFCDAGAPAPAVWL